MKLSEEFIEGLKEILRTGLITVIPVIIDSVEKQQIDWRVILVAFVISVLRGIDKFIHESKITTPLDLRFIK
jgi:hypothetical protein